MDALVLPHGCVRNSCWTRPQESLDASAVLGGRFQSELRLCPSTIWMRPASAVDALVFLTTRQDASVLRPPILWMRPGGTSCVILNVTHSSYYI